MWDAACEFHHFETASHFAARIGEDLAMLRGDKRRELLAVFLDEIAELEHDAGAREGRGRGPFGKRRGGGLHCGVDIFDGAHAYFAREAPGGGIENLAEVAMALNLRPADEMRNSFHALLSREASRTASESEAAA